MTRTMTRRINPFLLPPPQLQRRRHVVVGVPVDDGLPWLWVTRYICMESNSWPIPPKALRGGVEERPRRRRRRRSNIRWNETEEDRLPSFKVCTGLMWDGLILPHGRCLRRKWKTLFPGGECHGCGSFLDSFIFLIVFGCLSRTCLPFGCLLLV